MTIDEMIAVMQGYRAGKKVEFRPISSKTWRGYEFSAGPSWDFSNFDYRLAPEPMVLWVNINSEGCLCGPFESEQEARTYSLSNYRREAVRFVESPEDESNGR